MSWWNDNHRTRVFKMFCPRCHVIQKDTHICSKCGMHTVSTSKKTRWPKHPKKSDYAYVSCEISFNCSSGHPQDTLDEVMKFVLRYGNQRDVKRVEASIIHKAQLAREAEEKAKYPEPETVSCRVKINNALREFYDERKSKNSFKYVVNARVLLTDNKFDVKDIRKMFIPKPTKVYNKAGTVQVSSGIKIRDRNGNRITDLDSMAFFDKLEDAEIYSYELAKLIFDKREEYLNVFEEHGHKVRASFLHDQGYIDIDKRLATEAMLHLRHCKDNSLIDTFPHYYI